MKFCIVKSNWFFSKKWVWYLQKQPNLKKHFEIKKNDLSYQKAQDQEMVGPNPFQIQYPGKIVGKIVFLKFWFQTFNMWPRRFLSKNSQNKTKSNHIFPEKLAQDMALIMRYSDSTMA